MSWITKTEDVVVSEENVGGFLKIDTSDAYEVELTMVRIANSKQDSSKAISLVVEAKTKDDETVSTRFTVCGRDGKTYYKGKNGLMQHFGLTSVNTLFGLVLGKEVFDIEPTEVTFKEWNSEAKTMEDVEGKGFPDLIGKKVGVCVQMWHKGEGVNLKEFGTIEHFFDHKTGLFFKEEKSEKTKIKKWLRAKKEFKIEKTQEVKSSFGDESIKTNSTWG